MFLTKKAIPRRTFLRSARGCSGAASARRDDSRRHGMGPDAREAGPEARLRVHPDGVRSGAMDPARPGKARRAFTHPRPAQAGQRSGDRHHQYAVAECLSGYA